MNKIITVDYMGQTLQILGAQTSENFENDFEDFKKSFTESLEDEFGAHVDVTYSVSDID